MTDWRHVGRGGLLLICAACLGIATVFGAEAGLGSPAISPAELDYSVEHWTMENGLPAQTVTSLARTPDGFLWGGTREGLFRFDGTQFRMFYSDKISALNGMQILDMRCDGSGQLWLEGVGGELVRYRSGHFRRFAAADGVPPGQAGNLGVSKDGSFWFSARTDGRFYHYVKGRFQAVVYPGIPASSIDRFYADRGGVRWGIDEKRRVMVRFTAAGPEYEPLTAPDGTSSVWAGRLFWLQDGSLGVTSSHGIYTLNGNRWTTRSAFKRPIASKNILCGVEDLQGNFWVSVFRRGLFRIQPNGKADLVALPDANRRLFYRDFMVDRQGDVWVAGDDGLYRLRRKIFLPEPSRLAQAQQREANGFVEDAQRHLWILYDQGWARQTKRGWQYTAHARPGALLRAGAPSKDGSVYLAYFRVGLVEKLHPDGRNESLGPLSGDPMAMLESRSGELWVGTDKGLWHRRSGAFVKVELPEAPTECSVRGLAEDRDGRILVGAWHCGLYRRDGDGRWRLLTGPNDKGSRGIAGIYVGPQDTIWAATDDGLARYRNNKWYEFSGPHSAFPRFARSVVTDDAGGLWISAQFGVVRLGLDALNARADGRKDTPLEGEWFDSRDGLPSSNCGERQSALYKTGDGRIWVGTYAGAAVVDPMELRQRRKRLRTPPIYIERVQADGQTLMDLGTGKHPKRGEELQITPNVQRIEFRYTAINLSGSRNSHFRYQLEGLDDQWVDVGDQREAVFHRLPPGHYRFQVTAANQYGLRNERGASVAFFVQPFWWQTLWFRVSLALLILGVLWTSRSLKLRRLKQQKMRREEFARQLIQSQEAERKRIAGELHDGLGQNLTVVKNRLTLRILDDPERESELKQIADLVSDTIQETRRISHNLRPYVLDRMGLTRAIKEMVRQTEEATGLRIETVLDEVDRLLSPEIQINLYRVIQECLHNVVKHADAARVSVSLRRSDGELTLRVEDDGRGFEMPRVRVPRTSSGGMGLEGIEERIHIMGGSVRWVSARREGTKVIARIPYSSRHGRND